MTNIIYVNNKLIIDRSHSLTGFSKHVTNIMLENYEYECTKYVVRVVGYEHYINECTHIICCMRWWSSISSNSIH